MAWVCERGCCFILIVTNGLIFEAINSSSQIKKNHHQELIQFFELVIFFMHRISFHIKNNVITHFVFSWFLSFSKLCYQRKRFWISEANLHIINHIFLQLFLHDVFLLNKMTICILNVMFCNPCKFHNFFFFIHNEEII